MEILEPIASIERPSSYGKYSEIIEKVLRLEEDQWLPLKFGSKEEAEVTRNRLLQAMRTGVHRLNRIQFHTSVRENVLYVRRKQEA